jgi:hypothetical protein
LIKEISMTERVKLEDLDTAAGGEAGYELELRLPTGRMLPGRIKIRGYDSATYQQLLDEHQRRRLANIAMSKNPTVEQMNAEAIETAASLVMGWTVPFDWEGKPFEYSAANAVKLMTRFYWIREQVERAAGVRANFLPGSAAT